MQKVYNVRYKLKGSKTLYWILDIIASNEREAKVEARQSLNYYLADKEIIIVKVERA